MNVFKFTDHFIFMNKTNKREKKQEEKFFRRINVKIVLIFVRFLVFVD